MVRSDTLRSHACASLLISFEGEPYILGFSLTPDNAVSAVISEILRYRPTDRSCSLAGAHSNRFNKIAKSTSSLMERSNKGSIDYWLIKKSPMPYAVSPTIKSGAHNRIRARSLILITSGILFVLFSAPKTLKDRPTVKCYILLSEHMPSTPHRGGSFLR